jgi:hypothetical protein
MVKFLLRARADRPAAHASLPRGNQDRRQKRARPGFHKTLGKSDHFKFDEN